MKLKEGQSSGKGSDDGYVEVEVCSNYDALTPATVEELGIEEKVGIKIKFSQDKFTRKGSERRSYIAPFIYLNEAQAKMLLSVLANSFRFEEEDAGNEDLYTPDAFEEEKEGT